MGWYLNLWPLYKSLILGLKVAIAFKTLSPIFSPQIETLVLHNHVFKKILKLISLSSYPFVSSDTQIWMAILYPTQISKKIKQSSYPSCFWKGKF
jgi:archaellum biogenesis protein FlaJ (TadC family)